MAKAAERVFKSSMSKWIAGLYWVLFLLVGSLMVSMAFFFGPPPSAVKVVASAFAFVVLLFGYILYKAYTLKFTVTQREVVVSGIFMRHSIRLSNIKSVEKTLIPIGVRAAGASLLGGYYYVFGLGYTRVAMTNFSDGVLIKKKRKTGRVKYHVITPDNPQEFIRLVKRRAK
jgi:hypothetical protein